MAQASLFSGWTPRNVKPDEVVKLMNGDVNPFTNKPFGASYKTILEKRKGLPVYGYMKEFYKVVGVFNFRTKGRNEFVYSFKNTKSS
jgi:hypothetical protein